MEDKLSLCLSRQKIQKMKNPVIVMNKIDLEEFIKEVKSRVKNFKAEKTLAYEGIPIETNSIVERGTVIVYDNVVSKIPEAKQNSVFYFKVNSSKLDNDEVFSRQVAKVVERLSKRHNLNPKDATFFLGSTEDDFIKNIYRLRITFKK